MSTDNPPDGAVDGKDLVRRYLDDVFTNGNVEAMDAYLEGEPFKAGVADLVRLWRTAFPDFTIEVTEALAERDLVVTVEVLRGTHAGVYESSLGPIPATGRSVTWSRIAIRTMRDGRFVAGFFEEDEIGLLRQLDAIAVQDDWAAPHRTRARPAPSHGFHVREAPKDVDP